MLGGPDDFNRAKQGIVDGLAGRLVELSLDRFGTYVVQKCYWPVSKNEAQRGDVKGVWARALSGNAHGKACIAQM